MHQKAKTDLLFVILLLLTPSFAFSQTSKQETESVTTSSAAPETASDDTAEPKKKLTREERKQKRKAKAEARRKHQEEIAEIQRTVDPKDHEGLNNLFKNKKIKVIPVPHLNTDPIRGFTYGAGATAAFIDKKTEHVNFAVGGSGKYNSIVGASGSALATVYPHGLTNPEEIFAFKTEIAQDYLRSYVGRYYNPRYGRYYMDFELSRLKSPFAVFYGLGSGTDEDDVASYTYKTDTIHAIAGYYLYDFFRLNYGVDYTNTDLSNGVLNDIPNALNVYGSLPEVTNNANLFQNISAVYDSRPKGINSRKGTLIEARYFFSVDQLLSGGTINGYSLEAIKLIPWWKERTVTALRFALQDMYGDEIPFYLQSSLGGPNELRGFKAGRLVDSGKVSFIVEQRIKVISRYIYGFNLNLDIDPFVEIGRVFNHLDHIGFENFKADVGVGFRIKVPPNVTLRIDVAKGSEKATVYMVAGYPF